MYRGNEGEEEPDWVKNEREQFSMYRDKDGDGFLDADEVGGVLTSCIFTRAIILFEICFAKENETLCS